MFSQQRAQQTDSEITAYTLCTCFTWFTGVHFMGPKSTNTLRGEKMRVCRTPRRGAHSLPELSRWVVTGHVTCRSPKSSTTSAVLPSFPVDWPTSLLADRRRHNGRHPRYAQRLPHTPMPVHPRQTDSCLTSAPRRGLWPTWCPNT